VNTNDALREERWTLLTEMESQDGAFLL